MHVLAGTFDLHIPHSRSLKEKRSAVLRVRDRMREHFSVSCAEVGSHDLLQRAELGVAAVGADVRVLAELWDKLTAFVESNLDGEVLGNDHEILDFGSGQ